MNASVDQLLEFAVEVARRAGDRTLEHFRTAIDVELKQDRTPVTIADRAAEELARELIARRFPDDGIIGEEFGIERPEATRRWILDPIDGTFSFVHGVPLYGVLVAVEEGDDAVVGVAHFPALEETVFAARGAGCWLDDVPARVSTVAPLEDALVLCTRAEEIESQGHGEGWDRLRARAGMVRTWGDCYGHAMVATGRAEAMIDPILERWDAAALLPIVEEAGGVFTDWSGRNRHTGGSAISTNAALAPRVREVLGAGEADTEG